MPALEVHRVCLPPQKTSLQTLRCRLSEIFFPDDPLHVFKNQTGFRKFFLALQFFFPVFQWGPTYSLSLLRSDIISDSSFVPPLIYCVLGSSRHVGVGPVSIASLVMGTMLSECVSHTEDPTLYLHLAFTATFFAGVFQASLGLFRACESCERWCGDGKWEWLWYWHLPVKVGIEFVVVGKLGHGGGGGGGGGGGNWHLAVEMGIERVKVVRGGAVMASGNGRGIGIGRLGFVIDFLSKATLVGFMAGAAVIVSLQQLKGLLGIVHFTPKMQIIPVLSSVFIHKNEWSWQTIVMGIIFLVFLLTTRRISMMKPKLFWISAAAPLTSVVLSTLVVYLLRSKLHGILTIGHLPKGLNPPSSNMLYFRGPFLGVAIKTGIVTGILSLTEGIAVGRTFAALKNYQIDGNKEMMAIGLMNMAGSCSSCYVTTGSFSRSAVNYNAGAQTVVSNVIMALAVLVTLLFLMPLFTYTPNFILATVIITAVIGLIDYQAAFRLWKVDKLDFLACLSSFLGVLFISVPLGLAIAVGVSVFKILLHVTRPNTLVLGNIPGTQIYQNLTRYREALRVPSFLILAVESPIFFANSTYLQERILRWVREEEERVESNKESALKCIILDMTAVTAVDTSGLDTICELRKMLEKRSLQFVLVNPVGNVMEKLHQSNVLESFGFNGLYLTVDEAVIDISSLWKAQA
ncbi:putative sulfate transporter 3.4 [Sarracenia purpurea var. burkii]